GIGLTDGARCSVKFADVYAVEHLTYNATTGQCDGTVTVPASYGDVNIVVEARDNLNNLGSNEMSGQNVAVQVHRPSTHTGGSSGGGGSRTDGGIQAVSEDLDNAVPVILDVKISPGSLKMLSNETATVKVTVRNNGEEDLVNLRMTIGLLPTSDYKLSEDVFTLKAGETKNVEVAISPSSIKPGVHELRVRVGNYKSGASNVIELYVTGVEKTAAPPAEPKPEAEAGRTAEPGAFTGLFIGVGEFVWSNWMWILIFAAVGLTVYLNRANIAKLFGKKPKDPTPPEQSEPSSPEETVAEEKQEKEPTELKFEW
ncbi:MAG TPA: hypothetical protein ENN30_00265, partial [Candidatus Woesearchaeota archaeon]|nr:hypothetical protein [Candidatus Woesearchaeota archaeon]